MTDRSTISGATQRLESWRERSAHPEFDEICDERGGDDTHETIEHRIVHL